MLKIGCHLSVSKGYHAIGKEALKINANTFQFFTRNPRGGKAKEIKEKEVQQLRKLMSENDFSPILAHAPYTLNLCSSSADVRSFSKQIMADDLARLEQLPCSWYNIHPGSHGGQGVDAGIALITEALNEILKPGQTVTVLLETMAGKGSEVGASFEEIRRIIEGIHLKNKVAVCLDTCHIHDAGYDIVNDLDGVLAEFDKIIGLDRLFAIHLNDSMNERGSRKDRHHKIGEGYLGIEAITTLINHPQLRHLPFYLETPNETDGYAKEIELLKSLYKNNSH